ncbi:hypothetical protein ACP70R_006422 [Stipagrostis hirtigluma subsp. patula]
MEDDDSTCVGYVRLESKYSSRGALKVVNSLSDQQRELIKPTGFQSLVEIPYFARCDRKLYTWLLTCIDPKTMTLCIDDSMQIKIRPQDAHDILGVPMGARPVKGADEFERGEAASVVREIFGIPSGGSMLTTIGYKKMVGNILAPTGRNDKVHMEIMPALRDPARLSEFDWSAYVVDEIQSAAIKVQTALQSGQSNIIINGSLLFLQILYMENLPISKSIIRQGVVPRALVYTSNALNNVKRCEASDTRLYKFSQFLNTMEKMDPAASTAPLPKRRIRSRYDQNCQDVLNLLARCLDGTVNEQSMHSSDHITDPSFDSHTAEMNASDREAQAQAENELHHTGAEQENRYANTIIHENQSSTSPIDGNNDLSIDMNELLARVGIAATDSPTDEHHTVADTNCDTSFLHGDCHLSLHPLSHRGHNSEAFFDPSNNESTGSSDSTIQSMDFILLYTTSQRPFDTNIVGPSIIINSSIFDMNIPDPSTYREAVDISNWIEATKFHPEYYRTWISHVEHKPTSIRGIDIKTQLFDDLNVGRDICELAMRAFKHMEISSSHHFGNHVTRHFISPDWAEFVMCGAQPTCNEYFSDLFSGSHIPYNVGKCRM